MSEATRADAARESLRRAGTLIIERKPPPALAAVAVPTDIAINVTKSVSSVLEKMIPYSSHNGGLFDAEMEVQHKGADGSATAFRLKMRWDNGRK